MSLLKSLRRLGTRGLVMLSLSGALGIFLLLLACFLPAFDNWLPLGNAFFLLSAPLPLMWSRRFSRLDASSSRRDVSLFLTSAIVVSAFVFPVILARQFPEGGIKWAACILVEASNVVLLFTTLGTFVLVKAREFDEE